MNNPIFPLIIFKFAPRFMVAYVNNVSLISFSDDRHVETNKDEEFDLQFFADPEDEGRTEDPTPKRINEALGDGNIPITQDFPDALTMGLGFLTVYLLGGMMISEIISFTEKMLTMQLFQKVTHGNIHRLIIEMIWINVKVGAPAAFAAMIGTIVGYIVQTGGRVTTETITFDLSQLEFSLSNLSPGEDFEIDQKTVWEFVKSIIKLVAVGAVAYEVVWTDFDRLLMLLYMPISQSVQFVLNMAFEIIFKAVLILLLISPIDYWFEYDQWWDSLMMTPQEKDDERKQREGDPEVQEKQQEKMQEMAEQRMMEEVPEADVVITNPTHYSVALKYDEETMKAPTIVAKGTDMLAQRIRQLAREANIPIYEIPLLARTLYQCDLEDEIPATLYETVATVLAWVHQQRDDVSDEEIRSVEQKVEGLNVART